MLSQMRRLLDRLSLIPRTHRLTPRRPRRSILKLEGLEDRLCPVIDYWTGAGAAANPTHPNDNWSDAANWQGLVAPSAGDTLVFNSSAATTAANNDYAAGTLFNQIQISGSGYQIQGNAVQLQAGVTNSSGLNIVDLPITLMADQAFSADSGSTLILGGSLNNNGHLVSVTANGNVLFTGSSISGTGGLTMSGSSKFFLEDSAADSYTGVTTVTSGTMYLDGGQGNSIVGNLVAGLGNGPTQNAVVRLAHDNQIAGSSNVTVGSDGLLDLNGYDDTIDALTLNDGYVTTGTGTMTLNGNVAALSGTAHIDGNLSLGAGTGPKTFSVASGATLNITAAISGAADAELMQAGDGTLRLSGDDTYTGQTDVSGGILIVASADALGDGSVVVESDATLELLNSGADGSPESIPVSISGNLTNAGTVEFAGGDTGTLTIQGNYSQTGTGTLQMRLASANAFDQVTVSGTAALDGTLHVNAIDGFQPTAGEQLKIVTFGSSAGTFDTVNLPHPRQLSLRYDAQDLTIVDTASSNSSSQSAGTVTDVWTGLGGNDLWSNAKNWLGGVAPSAGDALLFPDDAASTNSYDDYAFGTTFASLTIAGSGYQIVGHSVTLEDGLTADNSSGSNTIGLQISFTGPATITDTNANTSLDLTGPLSNGGNLLTVNTNGNVLYTGSGISGEGGLDLEGNGTLTLDGSADTYTGPTEVLSGTLIVASDGALSSTTRVDDGGTLQLDGVTVSAADSLTLNGFGVNGAGALVGSGGSDAWEGTIDLASDTAIGTSAGTTLTLGTSTAQDVIDGPITSNLSFVGSGTVVLAGPDSYQGYTIVEGGTLALDNTSSLSGATATGGRGTTVDSGATLQLWADGLYALEPLTLDGSGVGGEGALECMAADATLQGPIKLNGDTTITSQAGDSLSTQAQLANEGYQLTVNAVGDVSLGSTLSGAGGLIKKGTGTLTFTGSAPNLYTGATVVCAGTLTLSKPSVMEVMGGDLTIDAGAKLTGTGTIGSSSDPVNVCNHGEVGVGGATLGTLSIDGNYTQDSHGVLDIELSANNSDELIVSGTASLDGTLNVTLKPGSSPKPDKKWQIMTFGQLSGQWTTINLPPGMSLVYGANDVTIENQASS